MFGACFRFLSLVLRVSPVALSDHSTIHDGQSLLLLILCVLFAVSHQVGLSGLSLLLVRTVILSASFELLCSVLSILLVQLAASPIALLMLLCVCCAALAGEGGRVSPLDCRPHPIRCMHHCFSLLCCALLP